MIYLKTISLPAELEEKYHPTINYIARESDDSDNYYYPIHSDTTLADLDDILIILTNNNIPFEIIYTHIN